MLQEKAGSQRKNFVEVVSPLSGIFYRAASPGAPAFVEEGDDVEPGHILCIIEAMKTMNEITSEHRGRIAKVLAGDGQEVQPERPLFLISPAEKPLRQPGVS